MINKKVQNPHYPGFFSACGSSKRPVKNSGMEVYELRARLNTQGEIFFMGTPRESSLGLEFFITIRTKLICS